MNAREALRRLHLAPPPPGARRDHEALAGGVVHERSTTRGPARRAPPVGDRALGGPAGQGRGGPNGRTAVPPATTKTSNCWPTSPAPPRPPRRARPQPGAPVDVFYRLPEWPSPSVRPGGRSRARPPSGKAPRSRCRAKLGLTQEDLGEVTGFDTRFIQRLERGRINFSIETLVRLATALEVPPGLLLRKTKLNPPVPGRPARRGRR
jgi:DNA-binding XRE family transcriptional regulator